MLGRLFTTFFYIGCVTFGGGYAMIPIIEAEVVDKRMWLAREDYLNLVVVAQTAPGVFAINISTFIGYKLRQTRGAVIASVATALPAFLSILLLALLWRTCHDVPLIAAAFRGIRPAVVALIAVPTFTLARRAPLTRYTWWIPVVSALLIWLFGVNPILVLLAAALLGYLTTKRRHT